MTRTRPLIVAALALAPSVSAGPPVGPAPPGPTFAPHVVYDVGSFPWVITTGDLDGDGRPDVITANGGSNDVSVLSNRGGGLLAPEQRIDLDRWVVGVSVGDVDGDGANDLVASVRGADAAFAVLSNAGKGVLAAPVLHGPPDAVMAQILEDLDGDGDLDVALLEDIVEMHVHVFLNDGAGTFTDGGSFPAVSAPIIYSADFAHVDVTGDGIKDMIVTNICPLGCDEVTVVLTGVGNGTFGPPLTTPAFALEHGTAVRPADLDGDGVDDVALLDCRFEDVAIEVVRHDGRGGLRPRAPVSSPQACHSGFTIPDALLAADFDGDGDRDLLVVDSLGALARVHLNRGDGTFLGHVETPVGIRPMDAAVVDLDGDGRPDVVTANVGDGQPTVSVLLNTTPAGRPGVGVTR